MKILWPDLHLHSLHGVVGPMPSVPSDPICVLGMNAFAIEHTIQVRVGTAVIPVAPCLNQKKKTFKLFSCVFYDFVIHLFIYNQFSLTFATFSIGILSLNGCGCFRTFA